MRPPSPAWGFRPQTPIRGAGTPSDRRELVGRRDRAGDVLRSEARGHVAKRDVPRDERHPQLAAAERHRRLALPPGGEEFGLPREVPADRGHPLLADRARHDAGKLPGLAERGRALERRPRHQRALAVRTAGLGGDSPRSRRRSSAGRRAGSRASAPGRYRDVPRLGRVRDASQAEMISGPIPDGSPQVIAIDSLNGPQPAVSQRPPRRKPPAAATGRSRACLR